MAWRWNVQYGFPLCMLALVLLSDAEDSASCLTEPAVINGRIRYKVGSAPYPKPVGSEATVVCDEGYVHDLYRLEPAFQIVCNQLGLWSTIADGDLHISCIMKMCPSPPDVPRATYKMVSYKMNRQPSNPSLGVGSGSHLEVEYTCSVGYRLVDTNAKLTCQNGEWEGPIPTCVQQTTCEAPEPVGNGTWKLKNKLKPFPDSQFEVGAEIEYSCNPGYKLSGPQVLQCLPSRVWSSQNPECILQSEPVWYCPQLPPIQNGYCRCAAVQDSSDLSLCMPFWRGTQIQCACLQGFTLQGASLLTCSHSSRLNVGVWDKLPSCVQSFDGSPGLIDMPAYEANPGRSYNSADITDGKNKVSSLVIVVTTACSVLGVLLLIMAVMVFRRRKPHLRGLEGVGVGGPHLFQQGPAPPPYARVHNTSMDEHDRLALMAYVEASRVHLPSYEEAMRLGNSTGDNSSCSPSRADGGGSTGAVPPVSNGSGSSTVFHTHQHCYQNHHCNSSRLARSGLSNNTAGLNDGNNNINNNNNNNSASNRHSTVTTSSSGGVGGNGSNNMYRDGVSVSEMFGSLDTVNVSMSDASTSVTVETYDSGTSCGRSLGSTSQQATAGSLESSHDQLANDDAPLLDSNSYREADGVSMSSNPSHTSKEEP